MALTEEQRKAKLLALGLNPEGEQLAMPQADTPAVTQTDERPNDEAFGARNGLRCDDEQTRQVNVFWLTGERPNLSGLTTEQLLDPLAHKKFGLQKSWVGPLESKPHNMALNTLISRAKDTQRRKKAAAKAERKANSTGYVKNKIKQ